MSRIYYRGARAAILCFDLTDGERFDKARFWSGELEQNEPVSYSLENLLLNNRMEKTLSPVLSAWIFSQENKL